MTFWSNYPMQLHFPLPIPSSQPIPPTTMMVKQLVFQPTMTGWLIYHNMICTTSCHYWPFGRTLSVPVLHWLPRPEPSSLPMFSLPSPPPFTSVHQTNPLFRHNHMMGVLLANLAKPWAFTTLGPCQSYPPLRQHHINTATLVPHPNSFHP